MLRLWEARKPLVTALVICYNRLELIIRTLNALEANHGLGDNIEIILWDNCSPHPLVRQYLEGEMREVRSKGSNIGVGAALNEVIPTTQSEYFLKADDDCILYPYALPAMVLTYTLARQMNIPLAVLSPDVIGVGKAESIYDEIEIMPGYVLQLAPCVGGGNVLIHRGVLDEIGPWRDDRLYGVEDGDYAARCLQAGYVNAYLKGFYQESFCRGPEGDEDYDEWKLAYALHGEDRTFEEWRLGVRGDAL